MHSTSGACSAWTLGSAAAFLGQDTEAQEQRGSANTACKASLYLADDVPHHPAKISLEPSQALVCALELLGVRVALLSF